MEPFVHIPAYPFVICTTCKVGCIAGEAIRHLQGRHEVPIHEARRIGAIVAAIPNIITHKEGLRTWTSPAPTVSPIPYIDAPATDGLGCQACPFVTRQTQAMQNHCREAHGWKNDRKRGRMAKDAEAKQQPIPWRTGVHCQRFFRGFVGSHWFEVGRPVEASQPDPDGEEGESVGAFIRRIQKEDEAAFESEAKAMIQEGDDKWEMNQWVQRTGWARHLAGFDRDTLRATREPVRAEEEPVLARMVSIFTSVMERARASVAQIDPGATELFEMRRVEAEGPMPDKVFAPQMEVDSWARYKAQWATLLGIWQRCETWEEEARPPYRMTTDQRRRWDRFVQAVTSVVEGTDTAGRYCDGRLEAMCLDMVVGMLDHEIKNGKHYSNVVISALAVMGIGADGAWVAPQEYTPLYAAVIKVARMLVLHQSAMEREGEIRRLEQMMDRQRAEEKAAGLFTRLRAKVRRFMTRVSSSMEAQSTPMGWIIDTMRYGMKIRYSTPGRETIDWRGDEIIHGKTRVSMVQLADMMHNMVEEARRTLTALTMVEAEAATGELDEILPRIPWSKIEDRHGESALGHSFLRHEGNAWWVADGQEWVMKRIADDPARQAAWVQMPFSESFPYRGRAVRAYGRLVDRLREQLWVLLHMTGGQPARSQEILGLRTCNTANGGVRNIFIHRGMVCFVTMYHKGARHTDTTKVIHRFVPREVGALLVWYMWLVLPFWQNVQGRVKGQRRASAFLWADEVVRGVPGAAEEGQSKTRRGAVGDSHHGEEEEEEEKEKETEKEQGDAKEDAADREEAVAFMEWYREQKWTRDRVLRVLKRYSTQYATQPLTIAGWRQMAIAIANRYLNKAFGAGDGEEGDDDDEDEEGEGGLVDHIADLQAGHGSHVAGLIYARLFGQGDLGTMRRREEFQQVSMQWHRLFGMGAADRIGTTSSGGRGGKRAVTAFDWEREHLQRQRFARLHRTDIEGALRQMMGPGASFRGMQARVIRAVMQGQWPIVQVTPTGGGKSLTFMLPAYCVPDGVTVVVTPLVALENDMVQRCERTGIDAYIWKRDGVQRAASIVFVTPESAVTKGFRVFVERMHGQQKMDRVVVDECHTLLEWSKTFRPQMGVLGEALQGFGVPVICLTATLKPSEEGRLCGALGFRHERVHWFRERTTRRNIEYQVDVIRADTEGPAPRSPPRGTGPGRKGRAAVKREEEEREKEEDDMVGRRVQEVVQAWMERHEAGKVIVYGGTVVRVGALAAALGCAGYWNKAGTAAVKGQMMEAWVGSTTGMERVIVATNALGLGVDVPDVRLVVHAGMPRDLRNFVQESGRGGRDGQRSVSVVVVQETWLEGQRARQGPAEAGGWEVDTIEFVAGTRCRREVLDREMDGITARMGCEAEEAVCDVCQRHDVARGLQQLAEDADQDALEEAEADAEVETQYAASQRLIRRADMEARSAMMRGAGEVARFESLVDEWAGSCVVCQVEGREGEEHAMAACPGAEGSMWTLVGGGVRVVEEEMFEKRRFAAFAGCFGCGMPQWMCRRWEAADEDGRRFSRRDVPCQYAGVLVGMYVGLRIRLGEAGQDIIRARMMADGMDVQDSIDAGIMYGWLGGLVEWGGMQASRICQVVCEMDQRLGA